MSQALLDEKVRQSDELFKQKQYVEAAKIAKEAVELAPTSVPVLRILGYALLKQNRYDESRCYLSLACEHEKYKLRGLRSVAETYEAQGLRERAVELHQQICDCAQSSKPSPVDCHAWIESELSYGDQDSIQGALARSLSLHPSDVNYVSRWLRIIVKKSLWEPKMDCLLQDLHQQHPENYDIVLIQASVLANNGNFKAVLKLLSSPHEDVLYDAARIKLRIRSQLQELRGSAYKTPTAWIDGALKELRSLIERDKADLESYHLIIALLAAIEGANNTHSVDTTPQKFAALDFAFAAEKLTKGGKASDQRPISIDIVKQFIRRNDYSRCHQALFSLLDCEPNNPELRRLSARCFAGKQEWEKAISESRIARVWDPNNIEGVLWLARFHAALGDYLASLAILEAAPAAAIRVPEYVKTYGRLLLQLGNYQKCLDVVGDHYEGSKPPEWIAELIESAEGHLSNRRPATRRRLRVMAIVTGHQGSYLAQLTERSLEQSSLRLQKTVVLARDKPMQSLPRWSKIDIVIFFSEGAVFSERSLSKLASAAMSEFGIVRMKVPTVAGLMKGNDDSLTSVIAARACDCAAFLPNVPNAITGGLLGRLEVRDFGQDLF